MLHGGEELHDEEHKAQESVPPQAHMLKAGGRAGQDGHCSKASGVTLTSQCKLSVRRVGFRRKQAVDKQADLRSSRFFPQAPRCQLMSHRPSPLLATSTPL